MTENEKLLRALGLCAKARALVCGTPLVCEALKSKAKTVYLVLCANDNAANSAKRLRDRCAYYNVPMTVIDVDGDALAHAIGKSSRVAAVAVTDKNLCHLVKTACATCDETT